MTSYFQCLEKVTAALVCQHLRNLWFWIINFGPSTFPGNIVLFRFVVRLLLFLMSRRPQSNWSKRRGPLNIQKIGSAFSEERTMRSDRYQSTTYFVYLLFGVSRCSSSRGSFTTVRELMQLLFEVSIDCTSRNKIWESENNKQFHQLVHRSLLNRP